MSERTSYAIFLSFMALFAALAANAKEPAARERAAVLGAVGDPVAYAKALEAYDRKLTRIFAPEPVKGVVAKARTNAIARPKAMAKATPFKAVGTPFQPVGTPLRPVATPLSAVAAPTGQAVAPTDQVVAASSRTAAPTDQTVAPTNEVKSLDDSGGRPITNRSVASDSTAAAIEEATAQAEAASSTISSSAM